MQGKITHYIQQAHKTLPSIDIAVAIKLNESNTICFTSGINENHLADYAALNNVP
jgi:hypothetical protein